MSISACPEKLGLAAALMVFVVLGPLLSFSPMLERVKRAGLRDCRGRVSMLRLRFVTSSMTDN